MKLYEICLRVFQTPSKMRFGDRLKPLSNLSQQIDDGWTDGWMDGWIFHNGWMVKETVQSDADILRGQTCRQS